MTLGQYTVIREMVPRIATSELLILRDYIDRVLADRQPVDAADVGKDCAERRGQ